MKDKLMMPIISPLPTETSTLTSYEIEQRHYRARATLLRVERRKVRLRAIWARLRLGTARPIKGAHHRERGPA